MDGLTALAALRNGRHLAAEVEGCESAKPTFVGVYPLDLSAKRTRELANNHGIEIAPESGVAYRVRRFSVRREQIVGDVSLGETDLEDKVSTIVFSEAELAKVLYEFGVDFGSLDIPANIDYPI